MPATIEPTIWMNVTTSANWKRSPVGVVRVEKELLRALTDLVGDRLRQVVFRDGDFVLHQGKSYLGSRDAEDFWPGLPAIRSVDPFDPIKTDLPVQPAVAANARRPKFQSGDIFITVGLDWELPGLHDRLRKEVLRTDLSVITCCYDLIPILYPQYCVGDVSGWFKSYVMDMSWTSHGILCISQNTKNDYIRFSEEVGLPQRQTKVIKLGSSLSKEDDHGHFSEIVQTLLQERYFLYVSTIERRKNHAVLYRAYHLLRTEHPDLELPKLIFVGMHGWGVDELLSDINLDPLTQDDIHFLNHVSDGELAVLYKGCEAFLYPSFYEGWGLPIAEALQFGRPVLASAAGSIPEVGGNLVRYVDPWSPRDWAKELLSIIMGEADTASWSQKISAEFKPYKWDSAAVEVLDLIREIKVARSDARSFAPGHDLSTLNGIHYGDKIIFMGSEGVLCHGPYLALAAGQHSVCFSLTHVSGKSGSIRFSAKCEGGKNALAKRVHDIAKLKAGPFEIRLDFEVTDYCENVEFVVEVISSSQVKMSLDKIEFRNSRKCPPQLSPALPGRTARV